LAHPTRAGEQEGVRHPPRPDGRLQGARDVGLAHHLVEPLRPKSSRQNLVCHACGRSAAWRPTVTARVPCGTGLRSLPLLPSGPGGVHDAVLAQDLTATARRARRACTVSAIVWGRKAKCARHDEKAEREGFEPSVPVRVHTLSRRAPSSTRAPLL